MPGHCRHARTSATSAAARSPAVRCTGDIVMNIQLGLAPIVSLLAGILILVMPRLLSTIVAVYLILIGLIGLFGAGAMRFN
jgi:Protein of unknown function (DUF3096)